MLEQARNYYHVLRCRYSLSSRERDVFCLAERLLCAMRDAAEENTKCNVFDDGDVSDRVGRIQVIEQWVAGTYSVVAGMDDKSLRVPWAGGNSGFPVMTVRINPGEKPERRLHVNFGQYGSDNYFHLDNFEDFVSSVSHNLRKFRLYDSDSLAHAGVS